ncbi:MAG: hypothetical protein AB7S50_13050 [Bacteroidales bacterium]
MLLKKIFLFGSIALLFYSCDPGATDIYEVDNQSDWKILVGYKQWNVDTALMLEPKELKIIYINNYLGVANDELDGFLYCFDSLYINVNDTLKIGMDYLLRENWDLKITSGKTWKGDGGTAKYKLNITNNDIVRKLK